MVALTLKTTRAPQPDFLGLPWDEPLADWPADDFVRLPEGEHRHVVRFLDHEGRFYALKELPERLAWREYRILGRLREEGLPAVTLIGVAAERARPDGTPIDAVLITRHLRYSLPYRALFGDPGQRDLRDRLIDALVVLLVRLHLEGFFWGDCSLNNALFRRDAGQLRAYLVDAETAEVHAELTTGQRRLELDIAAENVAGGLLDLRAAGRLADDVDPGQVADQLVERYTSLWDELTRVDEVSGDELWRIHERLSRLNDLGFDTEEVQLSPTPEGRVLFRPTIVDEGHHKRELERLTGIVAHENQARQLLVALRGYGAWLGQKKGTALPEGVVAYRWLTERWEPTLAAVPDDLRGRIEDAELYWRVLRHGWERSDALGREVSSSEAVASFVEAELRTHPDERALIDEA